MVLDILSWISLVIGGAFAVIAGIGLLPDTSTTARTAAAVHEGLAAGEAPDVALRDAVEEMARNGASHRFLARSAFVCIGRPGPAR